MLNNDSSFFILHNKLLDISHLRVFGFLCFSSTLAAHRSKFHLQKTCKSAYPSHKEGIFKGYFIFGLNNKFPFISLNVILHETIFPFSKPQSFFSSSTYHSLLLHIWVCLDTKLEILLRAFDNFSIKKKYISNK